MYLIPLLGILLEEQDFPYPSHMSLMVARVKLCTRTTLLMSLMVMIKE